MARLCRRARLVAVEVARCSAPDPSRAIAEFRASRRPAADAGCEAFHLGESGRSSSLARYKEKYGAVGMDYAEHRIEHLPATRADAAVRGAVKRVIGFREP